MSSFSIRQLVMSFLTLTMVLALTGCGGGSSGGTSVPPPPPPLIAAETVLYSFVGGNNGANDGYEPIGLIKDSAGNLYGTTVEFFGQAGGFGGAGKLFKVDTSGNESILHRFQGYGLGDGAFPSSNLLIDNAGSLYGTTMSGGASTYCPALLGCGAVFKLDNTGNETLLYTFTGQNGDGVLPTGILSDSAGNLYGITNWGGPLSNGNGCWCGTVFKLDSAGNETVLHSFTGSPDGGYFNNYPVEPRLNLVLDSAGDLFGTMPGGGNTTCSGGCGVVFKVDPAGNETVLYRFGAPPDGWYPNSLLMDSQGTLYGTTANGGSSSNCTAGCGTIFKVDASGHETILYSFTGPQDRDGSAPAIMLADNSGNFYGVTGAGGISGNCGSSGCGTFFKLDTAGHETVLYSFKGVPGGDGAVPSSLMMDSSGNFYGTTFQGGVSCWTNLGCGTVFKITLH